MSGDGEVAIMLWDELDLERFVARDLLAKSAAAVLRVAPGDVAVVDDVASAPPSPVTIEARKTGGDFPLRVGLYVREPPRGLDRLGAAKALAAALGVPLLRGSGDPNPYARELVEPSGVVRRVALDVALLDERGWPKLDAAASERLATKHREEQVARFRHLWAIYQDLDVGVPVTTEPEARALTALTGALSRVLHAGAPTREERVALEQAARTVRSAFASRIAAGASGLTNLLEAADIVLGGGFD